MMAAVVLLWLAFFGGCVLYAGAPIWKMWPLLILVGWIYLGIIMEMRRDPPVELTWEKMKELRQMSAWGGQSEAYLIFPLPMWRLEARNDGLFNWTERELAMACMHPLRFIGKKHGVECYLPLRMPE